MKILKKTIIIIFLVSQSFVTFAHDNDKDSTKVKSQFTELNFSQNLDSLLRLWYVQQSLQTNDSGFVVSEFNDSIIPDFADSVYIKRLSELPVFINLSFNKVVRNYINLYTHKKRDLVEVMLGLSQYYFPVFEQILDANDLPVELKYLPVIESALNPRAISRVGATGMWQFMYYTGKSYKLEINSIVDERRDPIKSSYAAANYLKDLYRIYDDWVLAIAAYNCGAGNVNKAIRRSGGKRDYWDIYYRLPRETRGYVPAFIAATYVMNYYQEHNLSPRKIDLPIVTDTIMVSEPLHLRQVAEVLQIPVQMLRDLNPQYRRDIIPAYNKSYSLKLPVQYTTQFIDFQDSIFAYKDSVFFDPNSVHKAPPKYKKYHPKAPSGNYTKLYYRVQTGDNLGFISSWYHVRTSDVRYWNRIRRNFIRAGQRLVVYVPKNKAKYYKKINSMSFAQKQKSVGKKVPTSPKTTTKQKNSGNYVYYTIKYGDNLWDIAKKYPGVSNTDIMKLNNISNARKIAPGQKIKIKPKQ
ncbi:MAG: transglycosylase SLT domain-containing protein [Bacteroidales bacterium]|nr:transglycosylase SLT domain-containing protein [Bacteroidales bacterium]